MADAEDLESLDGRTTLEVRVVSISCDLVSTIRCSPEETVLLVKERLCTVLGMPHMHSSLLELSLDTKMLSNEDQLQTVCADHTLELVLVRGSAARLSALPEFCGLYKGYGNEGDGKWKFELAIDSASFREKKDCRANEVEGIMHWRYVQGPSDVDPQLRAREWIAGSVLEDGRMQLSGYNCVPITGVINPCDYNLQLAAGGSEIRGTFTGTGVCSCDDDFVLQRCTEAESVDWHSQLDADIRDCGHRLGMEIRNMTGSVGSSHSAADASSSA